MNLYLQVDAALAGEVVAGRNLLAAGAGWHQHHGHAALWHLAGHGEVALHPLLAAHVQPHQLCGELLVGGVADVGVLRLQRHAACFLQRLLPEAVEIVGQGSEGGDALRLEGHLHQVAVALPVGHVFILACQESGLCHRAHDDGGLAACEHGAVLLGRRQHLGTCAVAYHGAVADGLAPQPCADAQACRLSQAVAVVGMVGHGHGLDEGLAGIAKLLLEVLAADGAQPAAQGQHSNE